MDNANSSNPDAALLKAISNFDVNGVILALDAGANPAATNALEVVETLLVPLKHPYIAGTLSTIAKRGKLNEIKELLMKRLAAAANGSKIIVPPERNPAAPQSKTGTGTVRG